MKDRTFQNKEMIDIILNGYPDAYLSIAEIQDQIQTYFHLNLSYQEIRYVLEESECAIEYVKCYEGRNVRYTLLV